MATGSSSQRIQRKRKQIQDDDPTLPERGTTSHTNIPKRRAIDGETYRRLKINLNAETDSDETIKKEGLTYVWTAVKRALEQDLNFREHLTSEEQFRDNVMRKGEKQFIDSLRSMSLNSKTQGVEAWDALFEDEVFLEKSADIKSLHEATNLSSEKAVERAWEQEFKGEAAITLLSTISSYLSKKRNPYSRQAVLINSSGTGKSRMVDQLSTKIITVSMCLRPEGSTGYPPRDSSLCTWLLSAEASGMTLAIVRKRLHSFVYALLTVTLISLEALDNVKGKMANNKNGAEFRQADLASKFRDCMTKGQSYQGPNAYRESFFKDVTIHADKFIEDSEVIGFNDTEPEEYRLFVSKAGDGIANAAKRLAEFVDPSKFLDHDELLQRPLVIFAFDEAQILTDNPPILNRSTGWNLFSELRRVLRQTSGQAIFWLFLSTAGRFNLFSPETGSDPSRRIRNSTFRTLGPITEISFDNLAYKAPENKILLERVVGIDWMCHLGRPLFASIYDEHRNENELMDLAKSKLLDSDGPHTLVDNRLGTLACLSVRFALEFMDASDIARTQVERHMRLCLKATAGRDFLVTLAGSEPLLAEAAYELMEGTRSNPVNLLANHSDLNCVDRGRRGELVAALIIMQACDAARAASQGQRWVCVDAFMQELLSQGKYTILKGSFPTLYRENEKKKFTATFKDHGIWFNHVIKVEKENMLSANHLWKFILRGAMVMCSNNQGGVDIVIPICYMKKPLSRNSVTAIMVQVKNSVTYKLTIDKTLFDRMDPIALGLFPKSHVVGGVTVKAVDPKPVIRIVFALATSDAGVNFPEARQRQHHPDKFTSFDVWCAGLGNATYKNIGTSGDLASYRRLLERALRPHDGFEFLGDEEGDKKTRLLRESQRRMMAPLASDKASHHSIHLE